MPGGGNYIGWVHPLPSPWRRLPAKTFAHLGVTSMRLWPVLVAGSAGKRFTCDLRRRSRRPSGSGPTTSRARPKPSISGKTIDLTDAPSRPRSSAPATTSSRSSSTAKWSRSTPAGTSPTRENLTKRLKAGKNVIAVRAANQGGAAAFIAQINIEQADGSKSILVTGPDWQAAADPDRGWQTAEFDDSAWGKSHSFGKLGVAPWGNIALTSATSGCSGHAD